MVRFFDELKRRNVFRVGAAYVVLAWLLAQAADLVLDHTAAPDWIMQVILLLLGLGFPVAVFLAWAFELTPDGLVREKDVEAGAAGRRRSGRNLDAVVFGVLALAVTTFALGRFAAVDEPAAGSADRRSVAVLPFENVSRDPANLPFTIGIHDDLLTQLSKIHAIKTISRTSMLKYRDTTRTIPEIAAELGVATVVEGGVQRSGDRVRINVQLIDAATDEHLWADTYDRQLTAANIFAIQTEIATSIAEALRATLSAGEQQRLAAVPTRNLEALDTYFLGKRLLEKRTEESLSAAVEYFEQVIQLDPEFALAHSGLADAYMILPEYAPTIDLERVREKSVAAATRALALGPEVPEVLATTAWNRLIHTYDWAEAEVLLRRALEIQANNTSALHWLSHVLSWQGRHREAIAWAERAAGVDPLSNLMQMNLSYIHMDAGDFDRSIAIATESRQRDARYSELMGNLWLTYLRAGRPADAAQTLQVWAAATGRDAEATEQVGRAFVRHGRTGEPVPLAAALVERAAFGSEDLAQVYAAVGDADGTIEALSRAVAERSGSRSVLSMKVNPLYDFVRGQPRFAALLGRAGLAP